MDNQKPNEHIDKTLEVIDKALAEEGVVLDGLLLAVEQNAISEEQLVERLKAYREGMHPPE